MSFGEQSAPTKTRSLCARKGKRKKNFLKKNSLRLLFLADSSFAIDAQQDKRRALRDWHPGCNCRLLRKEGMKRAMQIAENALRDQAYMILDIRGSNEAILICLVLT
jgi:hypothetical protein